MTRERTDLSIDDPKTNGNIAFLWKSKIGGLHPTSYKINPNHTENLHVKGKHMRSFSEETCKRFSAGPWGK